MWLNFQTQLKVENIVILWSSLLNKTSLQENEFSDKYTKVAIVYWEINFCYREFTFQVSIATKIEFCDVW